MVILNVILHFVTSTLHNKKWCTVWLFQHTCHVE